MAALEIVREDENQFQDAEPSLRLISFDVTPKVYVIGPSVARRRAARARMLRRRRRTLVAALLVTGLIVLSWPGHAFGGTTGAGLSTDLANSSVLASGMDYVVQANDSVASIAVMMNPTDPKLARKALVRELDSSVVVPGEHIIIP